MLLQCEQFGNNKANQASEMQNPNQPSLANFVVVCLFVHFFF